MFSQTDSHSTCILILGMHRSGTSCLAGSLQKRGLFLGQVHESNPFNRKGNRENQEVVDLNNEILRYNKADWSRPPSGKVIWSAEHSRKFDCIISKFNVVKFSFWGFKDPRTLLTLHFWQSGLKACKFVGAVRHPMLVAKSLQSRNGFEIFQGLELWLAYNVRLLQLLEQNPFPVISLNVNSDDYTRTIDMVAKQLGLAVENEGGNDFYDSELISQRQMYGHKLPDTVRTVYERILTYVI